MMMKSKIINELFAIEYESIDEIIEKFLELSNNKSIENTFEEDLMLEQLKDTIVDCTMRNYGYVYFDKEWTNDEMKVEAYDRYAELRKSWSNEHNGKMNFSWRMTLNEIEKKIVEKWDSEFVDYLS